ncbi:MAG: plastoquinol--plastocyanin reductase [Candidatus Fischerbacteria bacterium RBG_13_37_8]|uniref:Plastoquinol--plastocyanin reductase n=1 Tax=Candidatus Fischerbacteria bacterium RBG_13_37_8 TaxID=1817863 RepID=A0A1F5VY36_9BACT|nr:MAG: plastoquinol--plastocyanin reductase [Candidatus Fischerbacteria bacterium RBG_13_37_8]
MTERNGDERVQKSKRTFLEVLLGFSLIGLTFQVFYPIIKYLIPPAITEAQQLSVVAGKVSELATNSGKIFRFGNKPGILIKTPSGEIKAFSAVCTHLDCTVQYRSDMQLIWCACHNGKYNLSGKNIAGPPPQPLEPFQVIIKGDEIIVSKG